MDDETRVEWRDWGAAAFAEAERTGRPVLLSLTATWCAACHEMDAETYADPRVAAAIHDDYVPVRVDVDRRPRVRERYNMGGFPSTVFLAPDGSVITGAAALGPDPMRQVLDRVRGTWDERGSDAAQVPRALSGDTPPAGEVTRDVVEHLAGQVEERFDAEHGGWGTDAKFPLPRTVEFALKRDRDRALRTLDAVRDHLFDDVEGGFFRFAERPDWGGVHHEKTLDANAGLVRAFANAYLYTGEDAYRRPAERTVEFLVDALWNGEAFGGSVGPGAGRDYYGRGAEGRSEATSPRTDLTAYAGPNALVADALLTLHAYTDDSTAREYAERTLRFLDDRLVTDGVVARHRGDDAPAGLLADQARTTAAFARAAGVLDREWTARARAVADATVERLHEEGSFRDGPATGAGLLDRPLRPLDGNVEAASALLDLAALTGEEAYRARAEETIAAFAGAWDRFGAQVAEYGTVVARLLDDPLVVVVRDEPGSDLHRAAWRVADHEKAVVLEAGDGAATVRRGERRAGPVGTPEALTRAVADVL
ncbi:MAG: DUF255 domain-containing protein [Haloferacaceae archaeon]